MLTKSHVKYMVQYLGILGLKQNIIQRERVEPEESKGRTTCSLCLADINGSHPYLLHRVSLDKRDTCGRAFRIPGKLTVIVRTCAQPSQPLSAGSKEPALSEFPTLYPGRPSELLGVVISRQELQSNGPAWACASIRRVMGANRSGSEFCPAHAW